MEPTVTSKGKLTPEKAKELILINTHPGQRPIKLSRVRELEAKIKDNRFHRANIAIAELPDGSKVLLNGQHQARAVENTQKSVPAIFDTFVLNGGEDHRDTLAQLFAQYDDGNSRSIGNIAWMYAKAHGLPYTYKMASLLTSSISWLEGGFKSNDQTRTKDERSSRMVQCTAECEFVSGVLSGVGEDSRHMLRVPVVAAMVATFRAAGENSHLFWVQVRDGENLKKSNPAMMLRNYLMQNSVNTGVGALTSRHVGRDEMYAKCVHAWNAHRRQRPLTVLKFHPKSEMPQPVK